MNMEYDYIIVGAGSAGCALAYRLSREASHRVLLLEVGGKDKHPAIHIPLGFAVLMKDPNNNWCYETEPEPEMNQRKIEFPRGKVLGGSSSINGMVYIRGQKEDYNNWSEAGNKGWSFDEVLPYFKNGEHNTRGEDAYHGIGGPLWVDDVINKFELADLFRKAGVDIGVPDNKDFNGESQEGMGYFQVNIKNGKRQSTARTYLKMAENRPNLSIITKALSCKVELEGKRATGVRYLHKGKQITATARKEVILCGGSINSPQLLELSGIGNPDILKSNAINLVHALPGVGENLQDHLTVNVLYELKGINTFYEETRPLAIMANLYKYAVKKTGLFAHPSCEVGGFIRSSEQVTRADAQIHFAPAASKLNDKGRMITAPGTTATVCYLRPDSRGSVHINSANPETYPTIKANYLSTEADRQATINAVKKVRGIFQSPVLDKYRVGELEPGEEYDNDEKLLAYIRENGNSVYHPVGTCKMGHDKMAVVDDRLRVHGIDSLRVADASIMPSILSGNTHAACVMIAEKCADMILSDNKHPE